MMTPNASVSTEGECPTSGCTGVGHVEGARYATHTSAETCPYSTSNLHRENPAFPDRLVGEEIESVVQTPFSPPASATESQAVKEEPGKTNKAAKLNTGENVDDTVSGPSSPHAAASNNLAIKLEPGAKKAKLSQSIDLPVKSEAEAEHHTRLIQVDLKPESPSLEPSQYDSLDALTPPPKKM